MKISFLKTNEKAILPKKNHPNLRTGDAGLDLFSVEEAIVPARGSVVVNTGLKLADITPGYWARIEPRSGLGFKLNIQPHLGVIDNSYRGDLSVKLYNFSDKDAELPEGMAIAQLIIYPMFSVLADFAEEVSAGERGENGFGSSDEI